MSSTRDLESQNIGGKLKKLSVKILSYARDVSVDVTTMVGDITIYENIFNPTLHGVMTFVDAVGLLSGYGPFQLIGEEIIRISYEIPDESKPVRDLEFFLYEISDIHNAENMMHKRYVLSFCSYEHIRDAVVNIQHAYDKRCSEIVKDIVSTYLESSKNVDVEPTKGEQQLVLPKINPLSAIEFLRKRSVSESKYTSASYLFYETTEGFNFKSIEYMIDKGKQKISENKEAYTYSITSGDLQRPTSPDSMDNTNDPRNYNKQEFKTLFEFKQQHKTDTIEKLKYGMFQNESLTLDPVTMRITSTKFKFENEKTTVLGKYPENSKKFIQEFTNGDKNVARWWIVGKDSTRKDTFVDEIITNRSSYMVRLAENMFSASIIGDPLLVAGDVISVPYVPAYRDVDGIGNQDELLSGDFLIAGITHKLKHETYTAEIELYKAGYGKEVEDSISLK